MNKQTPWGWRWQRRGCGAGRPLRRASAGRCAPRARAAAPRRAPLPAPRPPAPSPAASSGSPSPFPHVWLTSKFREKAAWWLPERRRDSAAQRPPPGAPGGGRGAAKAGSCSSRRQGPAGAAGRAPPAPPRAGKLTFIKLMHFQSYFQPREACHTSESDRKRGKFGSFYFFIFAREGRKMLGGGGEQTAGAVPPHPRRSQPPPQARSPGRSRSARPRPPRPERPGDVAGGGGGERAAGSLCPPKAARRPVLGTTPAGSLLPTHLPLCGLPAFPSFSLAHFPSLLLLPPYWAPPAPQTPVCTPSCSSPGLQDPEAGTDNASPCTFSATVGFSVRVVWASIPQRRNTYTVRLFGGGMGRQGPPFLRLNSLPSPILAWEARHGGGGARTPETLKLGGDGRITWLGGIRQVRLGVYAHNVASSCRNVPINTQHPAAPCTYRVLYTFQLKLQNAKSKEWGVGKGGNKNPIKIAFTHVYHWFYKGQDPPTPVRDEKGIRKNQHSFFLSFSSLSLPPPVPSFYFKATAQALGFSLNVSLHSKKTRTFAEEATCIPPACEVECFLCRKIKILTHGRSCEQKGILGFQSKPPGAVPADLRTLPRRTPRAGDRRGTGGTAPLRSWCSGAVCNRKGKSVGELAEASPPRGKLRNSWVSVNWEGGDHRRPSPSQPPLPPPRSPAEFSLQSQAGVGVGVGAEGRDERAREWRVRHPGFLPGAGEAQRATTRLFPTPSTRPWAGDAVPAGRWRGDHAG